MDVVTGRGSDKPIGRLKAERTGQRDREPEAGPLLLHTAAAARERPIRRSQL